MKDIVSHCEIVEEAVVDDNKDSSIIKDNDDDANDCYVLSHDENEHHEASISGISNKRNSEKRGRGDSDGVDGSDSDNTSDSDFCDRTLTPHDIHKEIIKNKKQTEKARSKRHKR